MGLNLAVGILVDLKEIDEEGFADILDTFAKLNRVLRAEGLQEHHEPLDFGGRPVWGCDMFGYSGLHALRRLAAYLWAGRELPEPGGHDAAHDPVLVDRYGTVYDGSPGPGPAFEHLIYHSDAEGFYLPQHLDHVLYTTEEEVPGGMIGSARALRRECESLASTLGLPLGLDPESREVHDAADQPGVGPERWKRYGIESYCCLRLYNVCMLSIQTGAAVVFC